MKLKILIAEDDYTSELFLKKVIEDFCTDSIFVRAGFDAVEACRNRSDIDLVLIDIKMPVLDGISAAREIRKFNSRVIIIA